MKMMVVTDKSGKVVATYRPPEKPAKADPVFQFHAGPDQSVHELELPAEYGQIESAEELRQRIAEHMKDRRRDRRRR
jgi:hypothetical protein